MATDAGELTLKISADISAMKASLQDVTNQVRGLGVSTVTQGNLMSDAFESIGQFVINFARQSIDAFAQQEATLTRLSLLVGGPTAQAFKEFADQIQNTTAFSDDAVLALEAQLTQYGIYPGSVKQATQALVDFSAVTGIELPQAGQMLAQAMAGQSRALKQYGIDVSASGTRSENLATVIAGLESRFHSAAETMKGTMVGSLQTLQNQFSDLQKKIGAELVPVLQTWVGWLSKGLQAIKDLTGATTADLSVREAAIAKLKDEKNALMLALEGHSEYRNQIIATQGVQASSDAAMSKRLIMVTDQIRLLKQQSDAEKKTGQDAKASASDKVGATDREIAAVRALKDEIARLEQEQEHLGQITQLNITKNILAAQMELEQLKANEIALTQMTELETQKRLLTSEASWEANASFSDQLRVKVHDDLEKSTADWVNMASTMLTSFTDSTAKMIVEGGRFSDVVSNIWKQLQEQVVAQILKMITEWMIYMALTGGSGGFGFGAAANFFNGGHAAEGGMINEPSMVVGLKSGTRILAGEAGPEAIVPTGSANKVGLPGGGGGGGGGEVHVHINGQFLEGNPAKWQRLVQEQIIPQLRRFAMKSPNGLITRTRGALS